MGFGNIKSLKENDMADLSGFATKKLADDWGFSPRWVSLRTLQNLYRSKKELLKYKLREAYAELALEKFGGHSSENTYEPNYEWDDIKIRDRFDDIFEC